MAAPGVLIFLVAIVPGAIGANDHLFMGQPQPQSQSGISATHTRATALASLGCAGLRNMS